MMNKSIVFLLCITTLVISSCNNTGNEDQQKIKGTWLNNSSANGLDGGVATSWTFSDSSNGAFQVAINEPSLTVSNTHPIQWKLQDIEGKKCIIVQYDKAQVASSDDFMKQTLEQQDLKHNTTDTIQYSLQDDKTLIINYLTIKPTIKDTAKITFTRQ